MKNKPKKAIREKVNRVTMRWIWRFLIIFIVAVIVTTANRVYNKIEILENKVKKIEYNERVLHGGGGYGFWCHPSILEDRDLLEDVRKKLNEKCWGISGGWKPVQNNVWTSKIK